MDEANDWGMNRSVGMDASEIGEWGMKMEAMTFSFFNKHHFSTNGGEPVPDPSHPA